MEWSELTKLLTTRELECFCLLLYGKPGREIAEILSLSKRTIEEYIFNIKNKLLLSSLSEVIEFAYTNGFVSLSPELDQTMQRLCQKIEN